MLGHDDEHRELFAFVGEGEDIWFFILPNNHPRFDVIPFHHVDLDICLCARVEGRFLRAILLELSGPIAFEVDRVGENHLGDVCDATGRKEVLDAVFCGLCDPFVDLCASGLWRALEVDLRHPCEIIGLHNIEEGLLEGVTLLTPQAVGCVELDISKATSVVEIDREPGVCAVELCAVEIVSQHLFELICCFTIRAGIRHGQRCGDTVGRQKDILCTLLHLSVELKRKLALGFHREVELGLLDLWKWILRRCTSE